jgi:hypothetical protein
MDEIQAALAAALRRYAEEYDSLGPDVRQQSDVNRVVSLFREELESLEEGFDDEDD